ncbi:MAG: hypothetical protein KC449_27985, partial [Anaerolineales bacterium]|nr:hypothetical protein [Anaerolineales bacterium]
TFSLEYPFDVQIDGWITNDVLYYSFYSGGGHIHTIALNAKNGNEGQYGKVHGLFFDANFGFIAATDGMSLDARASAAVLTDTENEYGHQLESGPYVNILSRRYSETGFEQLFNSRYEDWHPNSPRMLVATWDAEIDLWNVDLLHEPAAIDLQLWDVETNELSLVVPRAVYGRFSSDGRLLLYLTSAPDYPIAHLYDWQNQQMIVEQPVIAFRESGYPIEFEMSFSPDGRFLTYFTPNEDGTTTLQIINSAVGETVWQIANPVTQMTWSPTSEAFIYRDAEGNLALFTVADGNSQPLTFEGGRLLTNPQWSYDGRYLSVSVQNETGGETAVLTFTNNP